MSTDDPLRVTFTHRVPRPDALALDTDGIERGAHRWVAKVTDRSTWVRLGLGVVVAIALAALTQALGLPLAAGLCVFIGSLPMVWLGGWIGSWLLEVRAMRSRLAASFDPEALTRAVDTYTEEQTLSLEVTAEGLRLQRQRGAGEPATELIPWRAVHLERSGPLFAILSFTQPDAEGSVQLPSEAFSSPQAFDTFCLAVQRRHWEAERAGTPDA